MNAVDIGLVQSFFSECAGRSRLENLNPHGLNSGLARGYHYLMVGSREITKPDRQSSISARAIRFAGFACTGEPHCARLTVFSRYTVSTSHVAENSACDARPEWSLIQNQAGEGTNSPNTTRSQKPGFHQTSLKTIDVQ